jgi:Ca2+-binding RTX toxin-like protein
VFLTGISSLNLTGNLLSTRLEGNSASNIIDDGGGSDTLAGMGGNVGMQSSTIVVRGLAVGFVEAQRVRRLCRPSRSRVAGQGAGGPEEGAQSSQEQQRGLMSCRC